MSLHAYFKILMSQSIAHGWLDDDSANRMCIRDDAQAFQSIYYISIDIHLYDRQWHYIRYMWTF